MMIDMIDFESRRTGPASCTVRSHDDGRRSVDVHDIDLPAGLEDLVAFSERADQTSPASLMRPPPSALTRSRTTA
ncbi:hypothetical protein SMICM304S_05151 [Streptomyces microflavus]